MRLFTLLATLSLLTACSDSNHPATPAAPPAAAAQSAATAAPAPSALQLECPAKFSAATRLPSGSRVLGVFTGTLPFLQAQMARGTPSSIKENWALGALEHHEDNESAKLPDGSLRTAYALKPRLSRVPGEVEHYLLACSYGPNWEALTSRSDAALVLIPVPEASTARCEIVDAPPEVDQPQPPRSATCTILSSPKAAPPEIEAFLEKVYAAYRSEPGPDTLGKDASHLFSSRLLELIHKVEQSNDNDSDIDSDDEDVGPIDGDPVCNCQDWEALTVTQISVVAIDDDHAVAKVSLTNAGKPVTVGMNLLREGGQWRMDDFDQPSPLGFAGSLLTALQARETASQ